jgi:hypothetical protein
MTAFYRVQIGAIECGNSKRFFAFLAAKYRDLRSPQAVIRARKGGKAKAETNAFGMAVKFLFNFFSPNRCCIPMPHFQRSVIIDNVSARSISKIVCFSSGQQKETIMAKRKRKVIQIDYADPKKKSDRFITTIDDDTVFIRNRFGGRLISVGRLAELTFDDASNPQQLRPEFDQLFDAEIAEAN